MLIDETTRRSLELTHTQREGRREGSLLDVLDETVTPMGARMLSDWLAAPLTDPVAIHRRLDAVDELTGDPLLMQQIREQLDQAYDLHRLAARVATLRASPRDLGSLARTLALLPKLKAKLAGRSSDLLQTLEARLDLCPEIRSEIEAALVDEPRPFPPPKGASSVPASTHSWTSCATWPVAARSGSPNTRPARSSGPAFSR